MEHYIEYPGAEASRGNGASTDGGNNGETPSAPRPTLLDERWLRLADHQGFLVQQPPATRWALTRWHGGRDVGVLPRGKTGLLAATGGVGKTYALIQLALAFATATTAPRATEGDAAFDDFDEQPRRSGQAGFWLGTFRAAPDGHVLLALAEEDLEESQRRLWRAANALELSNDERRAAEERIHLLPLHGVPVALTAALAPGQIEETTLVGELRSKVESFAVDWAMLIFDPLSRWAGGGVESNNELATRFCQVVERFTEVRGRPSVLVAHHSAKTAAASGTANARGVSGIRDGFRWMATMDTVVDQATGQRGVLLRNDKSNYSVAFEDLTLVRSDEPGTEGTLRVASQSEAEGFAQVGSREAQAT